MHREPFVDTSPCIIRSCGAKRRRINPNNMVDNKKLVRTLTTLVIHLISSYKNNFKHDFYTHLLFNYLL